MLSLESQRVFQNFASICFAIAPIRRKNARIFSADIICCKKRERSSRKTVSFKDLNVSLNFV